MKKILYHGYLFVFTLSLLWVTASVGCKSVDKELTSNMNYLVVWESDEERVDDVFYTRHEAELYVKLFENSHNYRILEKKYYAFMLHE
jgi:hypothetical protein